MLWQRRVDFGWWGLPGGLIEIGETISQCVVREVLEETGLLIEPTRLVGVYSSPDYDVVYPNGDQAQLVGYCFACRIMGGTLHIANEETTQYEWFAADDAPPSGSLYPDMALDFYTRSRFASFARGSARAKQPKTERSAEPLFKMIRRHIGQQSFIASGAAGFIQDEAGRVLLIRRGDDGQWSLPGGILELGERLDQTVATEVLEETGLAVKPVELISIYSDKAHHVTYPNGDSVKFVSNLFRCQIVGGSLQPDNVESLEVGFFAQDTLPLLEERRLQRIQHGFNISIYTLY